MEVLTWLRGYQTDQLIIYRPPGSHYMDAAERIFYVAISRTWTSRACCIEAGELQRQCPDAAEYLQWLLVNKARGRWPEIKGFGSP